MTRSSDLLERLRAANPHPGAELADPAELESVFSLIEKRRNPMTATKESVSPRAAPQPPRRRHAVLAFVVTAAVVVVAIGAAGLLLGGDDRGEIATDPTATTAAPVTTVAPPPTTIGAAPTTTIAAAPTTTVAPAPEATVRSLSDEPEYFTTMALTPDGRPVLTSYTVPEGFDTGTGRLFECADPNCDTFGVQDLLSELFWPGHSEGVVVAPDGAIYFTFGDEATWRYDGATAEPVADVVNGPDLPTAFDRRGNPVIWGTQGGDPSDIVVVSCGDSLCEESKATVLASSRFGNGPWQGGAVQVTSDGGIRAVYSTGEPVTDPDPEAGYDGARIAYTTYVASCDEPDCAGGVTRHEISSGIDLVPSHAALDAAENVMVWMPIRRGVELGKTEFGDGAAEYGFVVVACHDAACSGSTVTTGPGHVMDELNWPFAAAGAIADLRPVTAYAEFVYDPEEYASYVERAQRVRSQGLGEEPAEPEPIGVNLNVARCADAVCSTYETTTIATQTSPWYLHSLDLVVGDGGAIYVMAANDAHLGEPGLHLWVFSDGELIGVPPLEGTTRIQY